MAVTDATAAPLPRSGTQLIAAARTAGWVVKGGTGRQSLDGGWWHTVWADHPTDEFRRIQAGWVAGRLQSVLLFQQGRGWMHSTLKGAHAYLAEAAYLDEAGS